jgi:hypothetical protein
MNKLSFQCLKLQITNDIYSFQERILNLEKLKDEYIQKQMENPLRNCIIGIAEFEAKIQYAKDTLQQIKNIEDLNKE